MILAVKSSRLRVLPVHFDLPIPIYHKLTRYASHFLEFYGNINLYFPLFFYKIRIYYHFLAFWRSMSPLFLLFFRLLVNSLPPALSYFYLFPPPAARNAVNRKGILDFLPSAQSHLTFLSLFRYNGHYLCMSLRPQAHPAQLPLLSYGQGKVNVRGNVLKSNTKNIFLG